MARRNGSQWKSSVEPVKTILIRDSRFEIPSLRCSINGDIAINGSAVRKIGSYVVELIGVANDISGVDIKQLILRGIIANVAPHRKES